MIGIELGRPRRRPPAWGLTQIALELAGPEPVVDDAAAQTELPGDGGLREAAVEIVLEEHEGIPSVHGPPPLRDEAKVNVLRAGSSGPHTGYPSVRCSPAILCNFTPARTITGTLEWLNVYVWQRWAYSPDMPLVLGIGLTPLLQWLLVPVLTLWLTRRHLGLASGRMK